MLVTKKERENIKKILKEWKLDFIAVDFRIPQFLIPESMKDISSLYTYAERTAVCDMDCLSLEAIELIKLLENKLFTEEDFNYLNL